MEKEEESVENFFSNEKEMFNSIQVDEMVKNIQLFLRKHFGKKFVLVTVKRRLEILKIFVVWRNNSSFRKKYSTIFG